MATPTPSEMVVKIDDALGAILDGGAVSSYQFEGRSLSKYSLTELQALRSHFSALVSSAQGGARNFARFDRPS